MRIDALKFALAAGVWLAIGAVLWTLGALIGIPGFKAFVDFLLPFYGPWGYSAAWWGIFTGALMGFAEGFVHFGFLALLYNWFVGRRV